MRCAASLAAALAALSLGAFAEDAAKPAPMDCRECHTSNLPTKEKPALRKCPRDQARGFHKIEEAKAVIRFDGGERGAVVFSHKEHAAMAEMDGGCASCHHYSQSQPIRKCAECHSVERKREDVGKPDLRAALHRLCIDCHRGLDAKAADCAYCHGPKTKAKPEAPRLPARFSFKTKADVGARVAFPHSMHAKDLGLACAECHKQETCAACHGARRDVAARVHADHQTCFACHGKDECAKCHSGGP